jgi:hypothetical protein
VIPSIVFTVLLFTSAFLDWPLPIRPAIIALPNSKPNPSRLPNDKSDRANTNEQLPPQQFATSELSINSIKVLIKGKYHTVNQDADRPGLTQIQKGMFSISPKMTLAITPRSANAAQLPETLRNVWSAEPVYKSDNTAVLLSTEPNIQNEEYVRGEDGGREWVQTTTFSGFVGNLATLRQREVWQRAIYEVVLTAEPDPAWWGAFTVKNKSDIECVSNYNDRQIRTNVFTEYYRLPDFRVFTYYYLFSLNQPLELEVFVDGDLIFTNIAFPAYFAMSKETAAVPSPSSTRLVAKFPVGPSIRTDAHEKSP